VHFHPRTHIGADLPARRLLETFDALVLTGGAEAPRDLPVPGRELAGIYFAMEFLPQQNRRVAGDSVEDGLTAEGKHVVVIGGGDTGSDCIGTSVRQGALSVTQLEILPRPPEKENKSLTWPHWPNKLRTSSSHEEGAEREWAVSTKAFHGEDSRVTGMTVVRVEWQQDANGRWVMHEIPGSELELGVERDGRGNVKADTDHYQTSIEKVFVAGDMRRGQSLIVWAIREGRQCARAVDEYLMESSELPR
jgi:glutamate synthase (NADPH/NADH) small chain